MDKILDFLKNDVAGLTYVIVVVLSLFFILVIIGYLGDRQKLKLEKEIKKAKYNIGTDKK